MMTGAVKREENTKQEERLAKLGKSKKDLFKMDSFYLEEDF